MLDAAPAEDAGHDASATEDAGPRPTAASGELHLPIGFVMSSKVNQFTLGRDGRPRRGRAPGYHHMFEIRDEVDLRGTPYVTSTDGRLFRTEDVRVFALEHDIPICESVSPVSSLSRVT